MHECAEFHRAKWNPCVFLVRLVFAEKRSPYPRSWPTYRVTNGLASESRAATSRLGNRASFFYLYFFAPHRVSLAHRAYTGIKLCTLERRTAIVAIQFPDSTVVEARERNWWPKEKKYILRVKKFDEKSVQLALSDGRSSSSTLSIEIAEAPVVPVPLTRESEEPADRLSNICEHR